MKKLFIAAVILPLMFMSCSREKPMDKLIDESLSFAMKQYTLMYDVMKDKKGLEPRTIDAEGKLLTSKSNWWTSGFYPGSLWYLYQYSNDGRFKDYAEDMTSRIEKQKNNKGTHDLGFMLYCSFGNGYRLTGNESYKETMLTGAQSLCTRFRPKIGLIQSWNSSKRWQCPVIIDNMMNLEFLMWAFKASGDSTYYNIAVSHSDVTMKNHFRSDYSSYHVVSYDTVSGDIEAKHTSQGYAHESAWARGQAWGLYGYVVMYRETGLQRYLDQACHIADYVINHPNLPEDKIPYWDFNAPDIPNAKRDASAGAIIASALIELSGYVEGEAKALYLKTAEIQLRSLASPAYLAKEGENGCFLLKHSVGNIPGNVEVDVPLTYADYYFIEALLRYKALL